jgi:hypothetical protein
MIEIKKLSDITDEVIRELGYGFYAYHIKTDDVSEIEKIKQFETNIKTNMLINDGRQSVLEFYLNKLNEIYSDVLLLPNTKIEIEFIDFGYGQN